MVRIEDQEFLRAVRDGLQAGERQVVIAERLGISPATLQQKCARLGYRIGNMRSLVPIHPVSIGSDDHATA